MEDYFIVREKLREMQNELGHKLEAILEKKEISREMAWFNFNQDKFLIIWANGYISMDVLQELEKTFGSIDVIYSSKMTDNINIVFKRDDQ
jgi:hypothetical protein